MSDHDFIMLVLGVGAVLLIMRRLHRLGAQLEAVCHVIQNEVAHPERRRELHQQWRENREEEAKARKQFWWTWGIIGAAVVGWMIYSK